MKNIQNPTSNRKVWKMLQEQNDPSKQFKQLNHFPLDIMLVYVFYNKLHNCHSQLTRISIVKEDQRIY